MPRIGCCEFSFRVEPEEMVYIFFRSGCAALEAASFGIYHVSIMQFA